ncbi:MAG: phage antirepressor N-terminal domain-containing protein [Pseudomonadota bacterium]|nr:phage antirepressor N-terminal domain-containing protein [Pseudomonadota bacterium]
MTDRLIPVPFQGATLALIEHEGEPFAAMRPIVEGMGITWQAQHEKLKSEGQRWKCQAIVTVAEDGKRREMVCLPLRKLAGWLAGISVRKVKPEVRDRLTAFQAECDDALWAYWTAGRAERPAPAQADLFHPEVYRMPLEGREENDAATLYGHAREHLSLSYQMVNQAGGNVQPSTRAAFLEAARAAAARAVALIESAAVGVRHD